MSRSSTPTHLFDIFFFFCSLYNQYNLSYQRHIISLFTVIVIVIKLIGVLRDQYQFSCDYQFVFFKTFHRTLFTFVHSSYRFFSYRYFIRFNTKSQTTCRPFWYGLSAKDCASFMASMQCFRAKNFVWSRPCDLCTSSNAFSTSPGS